LYIKGVSRNCNILISEVKNCYDIKVVHWYNVHISILLKISLRENVGKVRRGFASSRSAHLVMKEAKTKTKNGFYLLFMYFCYVLTGGAAGIE